MGAAVTSRARRRSWRLGVGIGLAGIGLLLACSGDDGDDGGGDDSAALDRIVEESELAEFELRPGVELVTLSGAEPGQELTLYDEAGEVLVTQPADEQGRAHFAYIPESADVTFEEAIAEGTAASGSTLQPGDYVIRDDSADPPLASERFHVAERDELPDESLYEEQELQGADMGLMGDPAEGSQLVDGYQYIEVRDGVSLSTMVRFPDRSLYGDGPWPTVIELSGYGPSNPAAEEPGSRIARSLGYAAVSVNLRGTGCSGGVFDTFNPASMADGYDVVETVARQDWVLNNQVGMIGLSYSGITQLYTAVTQPPSLAAVTAQSVIADPWMQQWPGGIYNDGFTREWLEQREAQSGTGSGWVGERIQGGDEECEANVADQELNIDFAAFGRALEMRLPDADARDLRDLVNDIDSAVFISGAFQDEQTGAQFGALLDEFENAEVLRANLWNGRHPDGYSTMNVGGLYEFLELYVAERVPEVSPIMDAVAPVIAQEFGFETGQLTQDPSRLVDQFGDDYEAALEFYEGEEPVRVVFGSGLGTDVVGYPAGVDEVTFETWPPPEAEATSWYLGPDGELTDDESAVAELEGDEAEASFTFDPDAGSMRVTEDYSVLTPVQDFNWTEFPEGKSLSYETAPLEQDVVVAGPGYMELWVGVDAADADIQVSISEVRPDGTELLVQNGWLRLGHRAVDEAGSSELEVVQSFTEDAYQELPEGELVEARIAIPAMGHLFAEGSTLRVTLSSPGRNHVRWTFEPPEGVDGDTAYSLGMGGETPSALVLPVVDADVQGMPADIPCPGLRGVPCRQTDPPARR